MKSFHCFLLPAILAGVSATAIAQVPESRFELRVEAFRPDASLRMQGVGELHADERSANVSVDRSVDIGSAWRPRGSFLFRVADRHALVGNYYHYNRAKAFARDPQSLDVASELGQDIDSVQIPGISLNAQFDLEMANLSYDYSLIKNERFHWAVGLGLAHASIRATATGESTATDDLPAYSGRYQWKRSEVAPGIHSRLAWNPVGRWHIQMEGQFFDTRWGNFVREDGHFERAGVSAEYMFTRNLGMHVGYDWFRLKLADNYRGSLTPPSEVDVETLEYNGRLRGELKNHGPLVGVTFRY